MIDPTELVCVINVRIDRPSTGSIFEEFFQDDYQSIRKRVTTDPVTVHVSRLPDGAPASFGGGVGRFSMSASLSRDELSVHDAASLELRVTGSGNLALLNAPEVNFPPDFEVYDVKTSDIPGGKLFEYPFIPRSHGDFTIEPVEYSYFDISSRRYVTLRSDPLSVKVVRGASSGADSTSGVLMSGGAAQGCARRGFRRALHQHPHAFAVSFRSLLRGFRPVLGDRGPDVRAVRGRMVRAEDPGCAAGRCRRNQEPGGGEDGAQASAAGGGLPQEEPLHRIL